MLGDHAPTDPEGFMEFTKSLPVKDIYDLVHDAEPIDDAVTFQFPASTRRHYERLTRFPAGLLVIGDALCSFNPLYAQGMTACALETLTLRSHLAAGNLSASDYFKATAVDIDWPWGFSASADLGYEGVEGERTPDVVMANAFVARLQNAAVYDSVLSNAFIRAAGLIDPPQAMMHPNVFARVMRHGSRTA
jgi:hypothetical protein